jgi:hypothetical protein
MDLIVPPHLDAHAVLGACPDFKHESTELEKLVQDRGHILLLSPVCTPELAGGGIEYAWGKLKYEQRHRNETHEKLTGGEEFRMRMVSLFDDPTILPMERVFKFQRRARDYIRLYDNSIERDGASALSYKQIESQRVKAKTHRCVGEGIERNFISHA